MMMGRFGKIVTTKAVLLKGLGNDLGLEATVIAIIL